MFGSFFGCSAPILLALDLSKADLRALVRLVQNVDKVRLEKVRGELEFLQFSLNKLKFTYNDPQLRRESRKLDLLKSGDSDIISTLSPELQELSVPTIILRLEESMALEAKNRGLSPDIQRSFLNFDNERVILGNEEAELLIHFYNQYLPSISYHIQLCEPMEESRRQIFGSDLSTVVRMTSGSILRRAQEFLRNVKNIPRAKSDIDFLRAKLMPSVEEDQTMARQMAREEANQVVVNTLRLRDFVETYRDWTESDSEFERVFNVESSEFLNSIRSPVENGSLLRGDVRLFCELYLRLFCLDNDPTYISRVWFGGSRILELDQVDQIYSRLNSIQFMYFSRVSSRMFVDSLKQLSFSSEDKSFISTADGPDRLSLALNDIENYCRSMRPGILVEEVEDELFVNL